MYQLKTIIMKSNNTMIRYPDQGMHSIPGSRRVHNNRIPDLRIVHKNVGVPSKSADYQKCDLVSLLIVKLESHF